MYTFSFFEEDAFRCVRRTFHSEHQVDNHIRGPVDAGPVQALHQTFSTWEAWHGAAEDQDIIGLYLESISEEEQLNTGGK